MKKPLKLYVLLVITLLLLVACANKSDQYPRKILKENPEADILIMNGKTYFNASYLEWVMDPDIKKAELTGEIKKNSKSSFENGTSTILPVGTKIYKTTNHEILIVEYDNVVLRYLESTPGVEG